MLLKEKIPKDMLKAKRILRQTIVNSSWLVCRLFKEEFMNKPWTEYIKALSVTSVSLLFLAPRFYNLAVLAEWKKFLTTTS